MGNQATALLELERAIGQLSYDERLWLLERLVQGLRQGSRPARPSWETALAEMAADPQIQRELAEIAQEFAAADADGLEQP